MDLISKCVFFITFGISRIFAQDCQLLNGNIGHCVPSADCDDTILSLDTRFGMPITPIECNKGKICCRNAATAIINEVCNRFMENNAFGSEHIFGGTEVGVGEFPHMAAIGYQKDTGLAFDCGGTLISDRYVLTAGHCVFSKTGLHPSLVRLGTNTINGTFDTKNTDFDVESYITPPTYNRAKKFNDIALIRLSKPVTPFSKTIYPACLDTDKGDPSSSVLIIAGWGRTENGANSNTMLKAKMNFVSSDACSESYNIGPSFRNNYPNGILPTQLCARNNKSDSCQGDSGGPLKVSIDKGLYKIVGVTSFGKSCQGMAPGVYTRVSQYLKWIKDEVWPNGVTD